MCLESISRIPSRAREDIVCYKIYLSKHKMSASPVTSNIYKKILKEGVEFYSPCRFCPMPEDNILLSSELDAIGSIRSGFINKTRYYSINRGFHSFKDYKSAKEILKEFFRKGYMGIIKKCIIPRNTKYYEGIFRYSSICNSYCSQSIILKETINIE